MDYRPIAAQEVTTVKASHDDEIIRGMFKPLDGNEKELNEWLKSMSLSELIVAVQEIGEQVNGKPATA